MICTKSEIEEIKAGQFAECLAFNKWSKKILNLNTGKTIEVGTWFECVKVPFSTIDLGALKQNII